MRSITWAFGLICLAAAATEAEDRAGPDPLALLDIRATDGAAAGYVPDAACQRCHPIKYQTYQDVGMARSFKHPGEAAVIENFGREFYHAPTQRYYRIRRQGEKLIFRRHQLDDAGKPINVFETQIDWVLGSGNRARSYLYQTDAGELYQLPLGWYSEIGDWGMSPGFESVDHSGVSRRVETECMFCHNAFPEVPAGSDVSWQENLFPHDLPQGTGCQRCHGPGAAHIRAVLAGEDTETIHSRIVNPRKLPPEQRDSVCFQCHMLPAVAIIGARRFERPIYSFRPGELLSDYMVHVDIEEEDLAQADRFEINHHGYRFWQSDCYRESGGELACISCHDPHVKPPSKAFRARVAGVCRDCHQDWVQDHQAGTGAAESACVGCHMPTRRTRDVVLVTMTDHRIARGPFDPAELVKPLTKRNPNITDIRLLPLGEPPTGDAGEIYRIVPVMRVRADDGAANALQRVLRRSPHPSVTPYLDLLETQLKLRAYADAEKTARLVLEREPDLHRGHIRLGTALHAQGDSAGAMEAFERSLALRATPAAHYNLARVSLQQGRIGLAVDHVNRAIALRPNMHHAWRLKGQLAAAMGDLEESRMAFTRALEIEPSAGWLYAELIVVLRRQGKAEEANRYRNVGLRVARDPSALETLADRR